MAALREAEHNEEKFKEGQSDDSAKVREVATKQGKKKKEKVNAAYFTLATNWRRLEDEEGGWREGSQSGGGGVEGIVAKPDEKQKR